MKLQILVTMFNEGFHTVKPLLDSIAAQQNVCFDDIGVIVVNDGGKTVDWLQAAPGGSPFFIDYQEYYPFTIEYYNEEHGGVSAARNKALDHSTAEYIMFCDCDDMFFNVCGLWLIFNAMPFECYVPKFTEEVRLNGKPQYITRDFDSTFIHGKVFNRQYLIDKGIRWNESLTIHEDSYFNCLAQMLCDNVIYSPNVFYLWKYREGSVTRQSTEWAVKTFDECLRSNAALADELLRRGRSTESAYIVTDALYRAFVLLHDKSIHRDAIKAFYGKYGALNVPTEMRWHIIKRRSESGPIDEQMFQRWLNEIMQN